MVVYKQHKLIQNILNLEDLKKDTPFIPQWVIQLTISHILRKRNKWKRKNDIFTKVSLSSIGNDESNIN